MLKLLVGKLKPQKGEIVRTVGNITYFPQKFKWTKFNTVADVFKMEQKIKALKNTENGNCDIEDYTILNDD